MFKGNSAVRTLPRDPRGGRRAKKHIKNRRNHSQDDSDVFAPAEPSGANDDDDAPVPGGSGNEDDDWEEGNGAYGSAATADPSPGGEEADDGGVVDDADVGEEEESSIFGQTTGASNATWVECDRCKKVSGNALGLWWYISSTAWDLGQPVEFSR